MTTQATNLRTGDIHRIRDVLKTIFRHGNAADVVDLFPKHGPLLSTEIDTVDDSNEIRVFWREPADTGIREATLDIVVVDRHEDAVIGVGQYTLTGTSGERIDEGRYIVIWKQERGQWKLHLDIWSTR